MLLALPAAPVVGDVWASNCAAKSDRLVRAPARASTINTLLRSRGAAAGALTGDRSLLRVFSAMVAAIMGPGAAMAACVQRKICKHPCVR